MVGNEATLITEMSHGLTLAKEINQTTSKTSGQVWVVQNPLGVPAVVRYTPVLVKKPSTAACAISIGQTSTLASSANLIDTLALATAPVNTIYDNVDNGGSAGKKKQYLAPSDYLTVSVASGDLNGADIIVGFEIFPWTGAPF